MNRRISGASYFFSDIKKEGICLYSTGRYRLAQLREPDPGERFGMARSDFEYWFRKGPDFLDGVDFYLKQGNPNMAAFLLHQAAENLYHTLLLVFTGYKPKLHDLEKLGHLTGGFGKALLTIFPTATEEERQRFLLLKRAYTEARYERGYRIAGRPRLPRGPGALASGGDKDPVRRAHRTVRARSPGI